MNTPQIPTQSQLRDAVRAALPEGYTYQTDVNTGGGCTADIVTAPSGATCYITNADAESPLSGETDQHELVYLSYYDQQDEEDGGLTIALAELHHTLKLTDTVRDGVTAWVQGDPYRDDV